MIEEDPPHATSRMAAKSSRLGAAAPGQIQDVAPQDSIDGIVTQWLELIAQGCDAELEARRLIHDAPEVLRPLLRAELGEFMQVAQVTVQQASLRSGAELGGYVLGRHLGSGAFGSVWSATASDGEEYALKFLHPRHVTTRASIDRFSREVDTGKSHAHAGLVRTIGTFQDQGVLAIVSELVGDGRTLSDALTDRRERGLAVSTDALLRGLIPAIGGLASLHQGGLVHMDVKPANLLVSESGAMKLADFGLVRATEGERNLASVTGAGTPAYSAPEILLEHGRPTPAADIWSLGVLLNEIMGGERPFRATNPAAIAEEIRREGPRLFGRAEDPTSSASAAGVRRIIAKCLSMRASQRYPNAKALLLDLEQALEGRANVGASHLTLLRTLARRQRRFVIPAAALLALSSASLLFANHLRELREEAVNASQGAIRASGFIEDSLHAVRLGEIQGDEEVRSLLERSAMLARDEQSGPPSVRAGILSEVAHLASFSPIQAAATWGLVFDAMEQAIDLQSEQDDAGRTSLLLEKAELATRAWRHDLALPAWEEAQARLARLLEGPPAPGSEEWALQHAVASAQAVICRRELGRLYSDSAQQVEEDVKHDLERLLGRNAFNPRPWVLRARRVLSCLRWHTGDLTLDGAQDALQVAMETAELLSPLHPWSLDALYDAGFYWHLATEEIPLGSIDEPLADWRRKLSLEEPRPPIDSSERSRPKTREQLYLGALDLFTLANERFGLRYGRGHAFTAVAEVGHAMMLMKVGRPSEALPHYNHGLMVLEEATPEPTHKLVRLQTGRAICMSKLGMYGEAEALLGQQVSRGIHELSGGGANWTTQIAMRALRLPLINQVRVEEIWDLSSLVWEVVQQDLPGLRGTFLVDARDWTRDVQVYPWKPEAVELFEEVATTLKGSINTDPPEDRDRGELNLTIATLDFHATIMKSMLAHDEAGARATATAGPYESMLVDRLVPGGTANEEIIRLNFQLWIDAWFANIESADQHIARARELDPEGLLTLHHEALHARAYLAVGDTSVAKAYQEHLKTINSPHTNFADQQLAWVKDALERHGQ